MNKKMYCFRVYEREDLTTQLVCILAPDMTTAQRIWDDYVMPSFFSTSLVVMIRQGTSYPFSGRGYTNPYSKEFISVERELKIDQLFC